MSIRIRTEAEAKAHIGEVITYNTKDGREYGIIVYASPSQIVVHRLQLTEEGFELHPVPVCPRSRNAINYSRRIELFKEVKGVNDPVVREEAVEVNDPVVREEAPKPVKEAVVRKEAAKPVKEQTYSREFARAAKARIKLLIQQGKDQVLLQEDLYIPLGAMTKGEKTGVRMAVRWAKDGGSLQKTETDGLYKVL